MCTGPSAPYTARGTERNCNITHIEVTDILITRLYFFISTDHKFTSWSKTCTHTRIIPLVTTTTTLHSFTGLFSRTNWVSRHQNNKPFWILLEQEMMRWQWHQLDHMQIICTLLQTDNHDSTPPLSFYRSDALPATQPTASKH